MEVLLNINTLDTFRYQPLTFYNGYTLCKYEVLMSSRCLCVCVYQIPISCSLWVIVVGAKMSVLNTGVRLERDGWEVLSLLFDVQKNWPTFTTGSKRQSAIRSIDRCSMFDYPIALKFRFWVLELFDMEVLWLSPLHQASHTWWMYWFEYQIEPK